MAYQVRVERRALKALENISKPYYSKIRTAIYNLGDNPRPPGCIKLKGTDAYRIRVSSYRVIYEISS